jgi:hypothetical protein
VEDLLQEHPNSRLLLIVDQFEELYTLCGNTQEQQRFVDTLLAAVQSIPRRLTLVLTLRADFFSYILNYPPFGEALRQHPPQLLSPMNREEMRLAIERPAEKTGVKLEEGLTERILDDVKQEPGNLPLLEFALTQLWAKQSRGQLTHQAYSEIGEVAKALSNHAEAVYGKLSEAEQKQAQRIFLQLVRPGEGTEDTRRVATRAEVGNWELVTFLAGAEARLVVTGRDEQTKETVEVVHEALIREWERLREWMKSDRTFRTWQERLRVAMRQWEATGKDKGALLRGASLLEAQRWWREHPNDLQAEKTFIIASLNLRKQQRLLGGVAGLSIFLALALPGIQWWQQHVDRAKRYGLKEKISKIQLIPQTKDFTVYRLVVTEEAVWMTLSDSKEGKGEGLGRYDLKSKTFTRYQTGQKSDRKDNKVTALLVEGKDIWIGVENQGVLHSRVDQVNFTTIFPTKDSISSLVRDQQNRLWVGTHEGLYQVSSNIAQPIKIDIQSQCPHFTSNSSQIQITQLSLDTNPSVLWLATSKGLIEWHLKEQEKGGTVKCYPLPECYKSKDLWENVLENDPNYLNTIYIDASKNTWIGTMNGYIKLLNKKGCWFSHNLTPRYRILAINSLPYGFLLVSTNAGLSLYKKTLNESKPFIIGQEKIPISFAIHRSRDGYLWLGTKRGLLRSEQQIPP